MSFYFWQTHVVLFVVSRIKTLNPTFQIKIKKLPFLTEDPLLASSFEHNQRVDNSSEVYSRIYLQTEQER